MQPATVQPNWQSSVRKRSHIDLQEYLDCCYHHHLRSGSNLPNEQCQNGSWEFWKSIEVNPGDPGRIGAPSTNEILDAIASEGYLISDAEITFEER